MSRGGIAWLVALPLAAAGWLAAHALACEIVPPADGERIHGYLSLRPVLLACGLTLLLLGVAGTLVQGAQSRPRVHVRASAAVLLPPLGFVVQEHLERTIAHGALPLDVILEPVFAVGLALQLPFAVLALVLTLAVLVGSHALGRALGARRPPRGRLVAPPPRRPAPVALLRLPVLALGHGQRAPPAPRRFRP